MHIAHADYVTLAISSSAFLKPSKAGDKIASGTSFLLALSFLANAQAPTQKLEFDVTEGRSDERIDIELSSCIKWAYEGKDYQIAGPDWLHADKYDIAAKAAGPARTEELRQMLQTLLRERFQLQVRRETRELTAYALTVSKSGPKLHKAEPPSNSGMQRVDGTFVFHAMSMPQLADDLSTFVQVDRPVLDRTGIRGVFDFSVVDHVERAPAEN